MGPWVSVFSVQGLRFVIRTWGMHPFLPPLFNSAFRMGYYTNVTIIQGAAQNLDGSLEKAAKSSSVADSACGAGRMLR